MPRGLYRRSVDESITPDLPGKNSREAEKAAAAEDAKERLRGGEDAASGGSGAGSEDAAGLENGGFYANAGGAIALSPQRGFFGKGRGKGNSGKFKKYGPVIAILGLIFGAGGAVSAVQGLMPFHVIEQVTEMFDGSFTSRSSRLPRIMKSVAKMDGKKASDVTSYLPGKYTKYRKGLKKYKSKLKNQGIDLETKDGVTVLKWKNNLGEEVTIDAANFKNFYDSNVDFRNDFSRGTRGFMGRIAAWIDLSAARFFSSHSLTKNLWKDWQQDTFAREGKNTKFKDIIRGRRPEVAADVGTSKVEEEDKIVTRTKADGTTESRIGEVAQADQGMGTDGNAKGKFDTGGEYETSAPQTKTAKTSAEVFDSLSSIASGISNISCAKAAVITAAASIGYAMLQDNARNAWQGVAEGVDKTKIGDGENAPIYNIGNYLANKLTASAMISIVSGGKVAPVLDESLKKLNVSTLFDSAEIGAGVAVTCAIAKVAIASVSIITTALTGGVSKAISSISKTVLNVGASALVGIIAGEVINGYLNSVTNDMCLDSGEADDDPSKPNHDGGNCFAIGGLSELQTNFQGGGGTLGSMAKASEFYDAYQLALEQEAEYDRATKSPFDATNGHTFLGSIVGSLILPVAELSSSPAGFISSIGALFQSSLSSLLPSASAISKTEYLANQIGDCPLAESIGAVGNAIDCSPIMISDMATMDVDPDEVLAKVVEAGQGSKAKGKEINGVEEAFYEDNFEMESGKIALDDDGIEIIKKGSHLDKYIRYCSYRESSFGVIDQNIIAAETTASADTGNAQIDAAMDGALGALPVIGDVIDIWNAYDEMHALQWATGANCVARDTSDTDVFASSEGAGDAKMLGMARTGARDNECKEWEDLDAAPTKGKAGESTSCMQYNPQNEDKDYCNMPIENVWSLSESEYQKELQKRRESCYGHKVEIQDVEYETLSWEEVQWYQRYVEDDRLVEMIDGEHSAVQNLLASYEEENPVDNSFEGVLARRTGMLKEDVVVALNEIQYWEYLADYEPSDLYPVPAKHEEVSLNFAEEKIELPDSSEAKLAGVEIIHTPLRNRSFAA